MSVVDLALQSGRIEQPLALDGRFEPAGIESAEGAADSCREHIRLSRDRFPERLPDR